MSDPEMREVTDVWLKQTAFISRAHLNLFASSMKGRFSLSVSSFHSAPSLFEISELCIFGFSCAIFRRWPRDHTIKAFIGRLMCSLCSVLDDISMSVVWFFGRSNCLSLAYTTFPVDWSIDLAYLAWIRYLSVNGILLTIFFLNNPKHKYVFKFSGYIRYARYVCCHWRLGGSS